MRYVRGWSHLSFVLSLFSTSDKDNFQVYTGNYPFYELARDFTVILRILEGKKPTRPHPSSSAFLQFKLTEAIWLIMECCWETRPSERPTIHHIISKIHEQGIIDTRCVNNWEKSSASRFRNAIYRNDSLSLSVLETVLSWVSYLILSHY